MFRLSRRGDSLIELIVALVVLEILGATALAAALTIEHRNRHATRGGADDAARWHDYRAAETLGACVTAAAPDSVPLVFAETPDRPRLEAVLRCGR